VPEKSIQARHSRVCLHVFLIVLDFRVLSESRVESAREIQDAKPVVALLKMV
jgi:hypothetical protein